MHAVMDNRPYPHTTALRVKDGVYLSQNTARHTGETLNSLEREDKPLARWQISSFGASNCANQGSSFYTHFGDETYTDLPATLLIILTQGKKTTYLETSSFYYDDQKGYVKIEGESDYLYFYHVDKAECPDNAWAETWLKRHLEGLF
jgi:hypothetical protein